MAEKKKKIPHHDGKPKPHEIVDQKVETIQQRNARVEAEKAWETSITRRGTIAVGTYVIIGSYLNYLEVEQAWMHAFVPAIAYILSTLGMHFARSTWIKSIYKKETSS